MDEIHPLKAAELLELWERARHAPLWQRALMLLTAACPTATPDSSARLSMGQRNNRLLTLRRWTFGDTLACTILCPACSDRLEFTLDVKELQTDAKEVPETLEFRTGEYAVTFRLPNIADLLALAEYEAPQTARDVLLDACLVEIETVSETDSVSDGMTAQQLPATVREMVIQEMQNADPMANIEIVLSCPACAHRWLASLDVMAFFWSEIEDWAWRTLREIHILAAAYGWSERDILHLSAWRRQVYLEMAQA